MGDAKDVARLRAESVAAFEHWIEAFNTGNCVDRRSRQEQARIDILRSIALEARNKYFDAMRPPNEA